MSTEYYPVIITKSRRCRKTVTVTELSQCLSTAVVDRKYFFSNVIEILEEINKNKLNYSYMFHVMIVNKPYTDSYL